MERVISWLQNTLFRTALTLVLIAIACFASVAIGFGNPLEARAETLTPEASSYQVARPNAENAQTQDGIPNQALIENSRQQLRNRADEIREKLNLDKPVASDTPTYFEKLQEKTQEAVQDIQQSFENLADNLPGSEPRI